MFLWKNPCHMMVVSPHHKLFKLVFPIYTPGITTYHVIRRTVTLHAASFRFVHYWSLFFRPIYKMCMQSFYKLFNE